ncbi:NAD(P)-dependent dehydrogenase (short-subunit alcohol dehydrogenase family) [Silvibacterium bohemicum]|uniref:NAD(P)-dependent dehydrogenase (Short-subunit alcohol dehydrogenase family) n=1 Tax=Silvibacterium bohemicum TaxID=1577686 RepID=A0A841JTI6_9BACT|nr:SDR family NAD(P)-dependent oxidoreductase [Silvibacterium bohemicum]MBB6144470.1 NAD(P)-dependent dehydrogenase (short-subunit alcohol dehydrogenase family) [Silvibacterium bohemicum]
MKTIVMTGGTAGFGAVAAMRIFDTPNTRLILGARNSRNSPIETLPLDLARLSNVRSFVQSLVKKLDGTKIDSLIMNAGAQFGNTKQRTGDGFESTFAINHLAHYLLLRLLLSCLSKNATIVITTSDVHDPKMVPFGPKELDSESLAHPKAKGKGFIPGIKAYASSKLCNLLTARAFEASTDAQMNGIRVVAYNPGLTPGTSLFRAWPWWAKLMMGVASKLRPANTLEQAGNAIADLGLGTTVPPSGRIYASLVKGKLTWPDPSELAQSDTAMRGLWVESAQMLGLPEQA